MNLLVCYGTWKPAPRPRGHPVLVTDDGDVISGSREIIDWAGHHPAPAATSARAAG